MSIVQNLPRFGGGPARSARTPLRTPSRLNRPGIDWVLVAATAAIVVIGTLLVWSATATSEAMPGAGTSYLRKHLVNVVIGIGLAIAVLRTDHRWLRIVAPLVYVASIFGLVLVLVMGTTVNGSRSWLMIGGLSLQPAEFAKLAVVVAMALLVAERVEGLRGNRVGTVEVLGMLAVAAVPAALILGQPDLGTALVLSATVFGVLALSGAPARWLVALATAGVAAATAAVVLGLLKTYQLNRFMAFTNPDLDPRGAGYNTTQARIAIGNGGLFGQGLFDGSQTRSGFVPEQHTDFIFTVAGEELGLVGAGLLIALFAVLLWRALRIAMRAEDMFGRLCAGGIACWLGFQTFQNIGMCLGIMPVTGVPLPLVSYGGSSMFAAMIAVGLLLNIRRRTSTVPVANGSATPLRSPVRR